MSGRGYSSTNILLNLEKIKQGIKKRFRIYDASTRSVSAMPRITTIKTMRDLEKPVDTKKADKIKAYRADRDKNMEEETGPKFTGYYKGTDKGKPGKKMVGGM
jgi:hypothetical protein